MPLKGSFEESFRRLMGVSDQGLGPRLGSFFEGCRTILDPNLENCPCGAYLQGDQTRLRVSSLEF